MTVRCLCDYLLDGSAFAEQEKISSSCVFDLKWLVKFHPNQRLVSNRLGKCMFLTKARCSYH